MVLLYLSRIVIFIPSILCWFAVPVSPTNYQPYSKHFISVVIEQFVLHIF